MRILTAARMLEVDRRAAEAHGVPTRTLMDRAGELTARLAERLGAERGLGRVVAVCGKGNNGGDGLACAFHLRRTGHEASVVLLSQPASLKPDPAFFLAAAREAGVPVTVLADDPGPLWGILEEAGSTALVVDALFGTGFRPPVAEPWATAMRIVNGVGLPVLSVDLPSGLDADSPSVREPAVRAGWTLALGAPKLAHVVYPAAALAGSLAVADIGHPAALIDADPDQPLLLEGSWCRSILRPRRPDAHKGTCGHVLVVAGSTDYPGAALLTSLGALRGGAGLVTLASPGRLALRLAAALPEVLPASLPHREGRLSGSAGASVLALAEGKDALVIGPGLSRSEAVTAAVLEALGTCPLPAVVDADALNALEGDLSPLADRDAPTVITPHPGELARLAGTGVAEVQADRVAAVISMAAASRAVTVLKGAGTLVAEPGGGLRVCAAGNPGMASGGMGDVLSGLVGALLGQGHPPLEAASLGVYLHALAGDLSAREFGPWGFSASQTAGRLPTALAEVLRGHQDVETLR